MTCPWWVEQPTLIANNAAVSPMGKADRISFSLWWGQYSEGESVTEAGFDPVGRNEPRMGGATASVWRAFSLIAIPCFIHRLRARPVRPASDAGRSAGPQSARAQKVAVNVNARWGSVTVIDRKPKSARTHIIPSQIFPWRSWRRTPEKKYGGEIV